MPLLLEHRLTALLRALSIRHRLIASFVLLSLLPLLVSGYISYAESSGEIERRTRLFAGEVVKQVAKNVQLQMLEVETASEALVLSDGVQAALARYAVDDAAEKGRARAELTKILLDSYGSFEDVSQKYFLDKDNRILDPQVLGQLGGALEQFAAAAPPRRGRPHWGALDLWGGQKSIVMLRQVYFKSNNRLAGSLFLGVRPLHFAGIFDNVQLGEGSDIFILDGRDGSVVVQARERPNGAPLAAGLLAELGASLRHGQPGGFAAYEDVAADGRGRASYRAAYAQIPRTSWYVVSTLPNDSLLAQAQSVRDKILLIGLLCFVGALALAYLIARSISAPLEKLAALMRATEGGNYSLRMDYTGRDELAQLARKFNEMAGNIGQAHEQLESRVAARTLELELANEKLATLSMTDALTGIANRRRFDAVLEAELHRAGRCGQPLALLMIDVDHFKSYNDFYGHQDGDACLLRVARLLHGHARRAGDLAARYGGEEFVMLAADTDLETAAALAEGIRLALEQAGLPHAESPIGCVSVSIGVAVLLPDQRQSGEMFIRTADKAMYRAKQQGRNQVQLAGGRRIAAA